MAQDDTCPPPRAPAAPHPDPGRPDLQIWLIAVIAIVLLGAALRAMASVLVPVAFSLMLALVVAPVRDRIRAALPGWLGFLGLAAAMLLIVLDVLVFLGGIVVAAQQLSGLFPVMAARLQALVGNANWPSDAVTELGTRLIEIAGGLAGRILNSVTAVMTGLVLVFFLTLLMLIEGPRWRAALDVVANPRLEDCLARAFDAIAIRLRIYLWTRIVLGAVTAALYMVTLWLFGVDLVLTWGLLTFFLNFIPTVGSLVSGSIAIGYLVLTQDPATALIAALILLLIEQVMGNYVDPLVSGRRSALSSVVVLLALLFWGWIWGISGALLAVPMTLSVMIVAARFPALRPVALFLSDQSDMAGLDRVTR